MDQIEENLDCESFKIDNAIFYEYIYSKDPFPLDIILNNNKNVLLCPKDAIGNSSRYPFVDLIYF